MNDLRWLMASFDLAGATVAFALNFLAQSTVLIVAGLLAAGILRRFGSAAQSAIYRATLIAVLACPALTWTFSNLGAIGWNIVPPSVWAHSPKREVDDRSSSSFAAGIVADPLESIRSEGLQEVQVTKARSTGLLGMGSEASQRPPASVRIEEPQWNQEGPNRALPFPAVSVFGWVTLGSCLIWICCSACLLTRLVWGWCKLQSIRDKAIPIDEETMRLCAEVSALLHLAAPCVLKTPFLSGPCLAGSFRPVILLPEWDPHPAMRSILIHELAHLRRRDLLWNLLRQLATALLFFQPLLWRLSRELEVAAEEACDDWVVELGADRQVYAHALADVAQWASVPMGSASVAMAAQRSQLARRVGRILDRSRPLSLGVDRRLTSAIAMAACLGALSVAAAGTGPSRFAKPAGPKATPIDEKNYEISSGDQDAWQAIPSFEKTVDSVIVRGLVLKPDGTPAKGARVNLRRSDEPPNADKSILVTSVAQEEGKFTLRYRRVSRNGTARTGPECFDVTAQAHGFGMQWISHVDVLPSQPLVLSLNPEYPIHGRIVDAQGKPIAGVEVGARIIRARKNGADLKPWIEILAAGGDSRAGDWKLDRVLTDVRFLQEGRLLTDRDGRFTLAGLGPENVVDLDLRGETIANQRVTATTRKMEPFTRILWPSLSPPLHHDRVFGADFTYAAVPTRIVEGTIRDAFTKQPLPHVVIKSQRLAGMRLDYFSGEDPDRTISATQGRYRLAGEDPVRTISDAQGRYRLVGLPKSTGPEYRDINQIWVLPGNDSPYFKREIQIPAAEGNGPQSFDIEMHQGIWIHGRVTEKGTGKPIQAQVAYRPYFANPDLRQLPEFHEDGDGGGPDAHSVLTDREGRFRLPALPVRAIVTARSIDGRYLYGIGSEQIPGKDEWGYYPTIGGPGAANARTVHALKEIDPKVGAIETPCDFVLDPGETMRLAVVDQAGNPVPGCRLVREKGIHSDPSTSAELEIPGLAPGQPTDFMVIHKERRLGKIVTLTWKQDGPRTTAVTLEPCATVKGRVVDEQGKPFKILQLVAVSKKVRVHIGNPMSYTNADGTFEYPHLLIGGNEYVIGLMGEEVDRQVAFIARDLKVQAGQVVDLGTIKIPRKK